MLISLHPLIARAEPKSRRFKLTTAPHQSEPYLIQLAF